MHLFELRGDQDSVTCHVHAIRLFATLVFGLAACTQGATDGPPAAPPVEVDAVDATFDTLDISADEIRGVLSLINAPTTTFEVLQPLVESDAAEGITDDRPILSQAQLDAVAFVGPLAWNALEAEACHARGLCEPPIEILSWNVENFPNSAQTVPAVRTILGELAPTVVGFQEILNRVVFREMIDSLPNYEGFAGEQRGRDTAVAFAYRSDRVFIEDVRSLFIDDNWAFPRAPMAITFSMTGRAGHGIFTMVVVHLKARGDEQSEARRREAMQKLAVWVAEHSDTVTPNVFIVGDFNDHLMDAPEDDVFGPFRSDAYAILTQPLADIGEYSYIPETYRGLIDHVVSTDDAAANFPALSIEAFAAEARIEGYVELVSDHRPVRSRHVPILPAWR
ncbi:MAG: endonuclease/exonuclease/phosphatase family metal-dependent hydrolase [Polyangiales bacterium]|jgi:endonuclease/exonuclease/phosphatase family metal-dependent hydrolase